jgi:hypothetical protein
MKIVNTDLAMQSAHGALTRDTSRETLLAWRGERPDFSASTRNGNNSAMPSTLAKISAAGWQALLNAVGGNAAATAPTFTPLDGNATQAIDAALDAADNDPFVVLIRRMLEILTGKQIKVFNAASFATEMRRTEINAAQTSATAQAAASGRAGFGVEYDFHAVHEELETTSFSAAGVVRTADGQEIDFRLDLEMSRYFREETNLSVRAGDAVRKDPLVVNFGGTAAQLSGLANQRFSFDLDGDGRLDELPLFTSGSGYLALDLNRNGRIDSGKELFGPQSGNGFADLARLDSDGNGWIDEGDAAFAQLAVWTPDAAGQGKLQSLGELGIGALALAHAATPFALRDGNNTDLGMVKSSGVYLTESGQAGSLQEIDLTA